MYIIGLEVAAVECRLLQRHFLKSANKRRDVDAALQFVQLLPQNVVDVRTYTMLIGVCVAARDAAAALSVADSWREMGRKLDTKMYTSVITGEVGISHPVTAHPLVVKGNCVALLSQSYSPIIDS
jgi:pentatricopeptide repeat protein